MTFLAVPWTDGKVTVSHYCVSLCPRLPLLFNRTILVHEKRSTSCYEVLAAVAHRETPSLPTSFTALHQQTPRLCSSLNPSSLLLVPPLRDSDHPSSPRDHWMVRVSDCLVLAAVPEAVATMLLPGLIPSDLLILEVLVQQKVSAQFALVGYAHYCRT